VVLSNSSLAVWKAAHPPDCSAWRLALLVDQLLQREQYDQLEELANLLARDGETFPWSPAQTRYRSLEEIAIAYPGVLSDRGIKGEHLSAWREAAPKSKLALIASAQQLIDQGWAVRGDNFAFAVNPQDAKTFEDNLEQARQLIRILVDEEDCPPEAYTVLFEVAKGQGWMDSLLHRYLERLLADDPTYFMPHLNLSEKLMPRWGGAPEDCIDHAEKVAKRVGGDAGELIYARIALRLLPYHNPVEFWQRSGFEYERVQRALAKRLEAHPTDAFALTRGAMIAFDERDQSRLKALVGQLDRNRVVPEMSVMFKPFQLYFLLQAAAQPPSESGATP
jgi:hypothetical protein